MDTTPSPLNSAERELVALGAALASNCVPCIEHHVPAARAAGLDDRKIRAALALADQVRQVPARKVLAAAQGLTQAGGTAAPASGEAGCSAAAPKAGEPTPCCA